MVRDSYKVVGVMSGTSLDGIDLCYCEFWKDDNLWKQRIIFSETKKYPIKWYEILRNAIKKTKEEVDSIDKEYSFFLANEINEFIHNNSLEVDLICSHGHTIFHEPQNGYTKQIGNRKTLLEIIKKPIVCDFRIQDVRLGGQGAPLVPIGDRLLFSDYDYCINLGGFANISNEVNNQRIAYDICPINIVLNKYVSEIGLDYDNKGQISSKGKVNTSLLKKLNNLNYYKKAYPKSLGLEWVKENIFPIINKFQLSLEDLLRTYIEHAAIQIVYCLDNDSSSKVLITGGGVYNSFLIGRIKALTKCQVCIPNKDLIEYKEALIFGFLGVLRIRNEINCLSSVTGAKHNHSSGVIFNNSND